MERLSDKTLRALRPGSVSTRQRPPAGDDFVKFVGALAVSRMNAGGSQSALAFLRECDGEHLGAVLEFHLGQRLGPALRNQREATPLGKSAVAVGDAHDANFADALSDYQSIVSGFLQELNPRTIVGQLRGLQRVPFNELIVEEQVSATGGFVEAGHPVPISALSFLNHTMRPLQCSVALALTKDLIRSWSAGAAAFVKASLLRKLQNALDRAFIDPAVAGDGDVTPLSVTAAAETAGDVLDSGGASAATIASDLEEVADLLIALGSDLSSASWVLHPRSATYLASLLGSGGAPSFPDMGIGGGSMLGLPAITSTAVPIESGSPQHTSIALVDPTRIYYADDGGLEVDPTEEATAQMLTDPSTGAQAQVSFWQQNLIGIRCDRWLNWAPGIGACALLRSVSF